MPYVVLTKYDTEEKEKLVTKRKKSVKPIDTKLRKSPTPVSEMVNQRISPSVERESNVSAVSRSFYDSESDDNNPQFELNHKNITYHEENQFGGTLGNFILSMSLPILIVLAQIGLKAKGNLIPFPQGYLRLTNYYDQNVFIWSAAIVFIQLLISVVPLAKKTQGLQNIMNGLQYYRFSGIINLIIGVLIVAVMDYYKCPINFIIEIVTKKTVPYIVASVLYALLISIVLYLKTKFSNKVDECNSLNIVQKLFIGTTINPTLGPINIKLALYRYSALMTILYNSLIIMDNLKHPNNIYLNYVAGCQILFSVDKLAFENNLLSSFYLQNEKVGYWTILQQFVQPAIHILPIQILISNKLPVNYYILTISGITFLFGLICQRYSNLIKYHFVLKTNAHLSTGGIEVVRRGLWSYIRYPQYLGVIVLHLALILPIIEPNVASLKSSWPILFYPLYYIVTLSHRSTRISNYCRLKYGYSWDYKCIAKWNILPNIF
ncbi:Ergosterol biosynthesis ERG4/ERG24 [Cinara cedri]|uniref:Ergosterol biosynthesis ERG4/ERG24 n=1 Tax=Cinara cedri TaxID=506608 RepID=A0A5E4MP91_9HEMI|nr:Ergosterol biosynthesis ERG4/ERG24 [Cinara cedri]